LVDRDWDVVAIANEAYKATHDADESAHGAQVWIVIVGYVILFFIACAIFLNRKIELQRRDEQYGHLNQFCVDNVGDGDRSFPLEEGDVIQGECHCFVSTEVTCVGGEVRLLIGRIPTPGSLLGGQLR
jgi:hypothetical protein